MDKQQTADVSNFRQSFDHISAEELRVNVGNVELEVDDDDLDVDEAEVIDDDIDAEPSDERCYPWSPRFLCYPSPCSSPFCDTFAPMRLFVQELLSPWILASPTFIFMLLSSTATMMGLLVPFLMLPDLLAELNWPLADSRFTISTIAFGNTVGRALATLYIVKGWSSTYRWANCLWLNNASLFLASLSISAMPVARTHYPSLNLACIIFGFCSAVFVSLRSILVVELLGLERLTNAFGHMLLLQGLAAAGGPPFAGYLRELRLSYFTPFDISLGHMAPVHHASSMGFYFSGVCLFVACLFACPLRWLSRREHAAPPLETQLSSAVNPAFDFGPNHLVPDVPTSGTGDTEMYSDLELGHPTDQHPSNVLSDGQQHYDQPALPFTANSQSDQPSGQLPCIGTPISNIVPLSVQSNPIGDVVTPCLLSTINEGIPLSIGVAATLNPTDLVTPSASCTRSEDLTDFDGIAGSVLGTLVIPASGGPVSVVSTAIPTKMVDVKSVQEEPGLEPVAEEEEEEEYEDEPEAPPASAPTQIQPQGSFTIRRFEVVPLVESALRESSDACSSDSTSVASTLPLDPTKWKKKKRRKIVQAKQSDDLHPTSPGEDLVKLESSEKNGADGDAAV